ncbi:MAG: dTDP-4-dehydrorhamnose 3,5-epimerase, partial [Coriobacteriales bacterium]|nr:dTDP-4-dehydrorhamnose 3,5-epimerase [Coriobacteriales bacterium]
MIRMPGFAFKELELQGAWLVEPLWVTDERGGFLKDYNVETFKNAGITHELKETFYTVSHRGVIRAMHFQLERQQPKLVRCVKGRVWDAIVDLRPYSKTYGHWQAFELSEENRLELLVPAWFGHGYLVLEDSIVSYKCGEVFYAEGDSGIAYNDSDLAIAWPFAEIGGESKLIMSEKDRQLMSFAEYDKLVGEGAGMAPRA